MLTRSYTDALEASLGRVVGDMQRQFQVYVAQSDAVIAQLQARATEAEFRFTALEKATAERLEAAEHAAMARVDAQLAAMAPADPAEVAATVKALIDGAVAEAVSGLPAPVVPDVVPIVAEAVQAAVAAIPAARDGKDGADGRDGLDGKDGLDGAPGRDGVDGLNGKDADPAEMESLRALVMAVSESIPTIPDAPDLSGFATKADVEAVRAAIPAIPEARDWTPEIENVKALIPAMPDAPDLSAFVTADQVKAMIPATPEAKDWTPEIEAVKALIPAIPEPADLSGFATKDEVAEVRSAIPVIPEARDWTPEIEATKAAIADALERVARHPGRFPVAKAYAEGVAYAGDVVTHKGATWQAIRDTGREPPHEDWACLSARGEPGQVGKSMTVRGTFDPAEVYAHLDVVARNGSGWIAKHDNPGECPGDGWQLIASKGGKGDAINGEPGKAASVVGASLDDEGVLTLTNADGSTVTADFYPLLVRK